MADIFQSIFRCIFLGENNHVWIWISVNIVPDSSIDSFVPDDSISKNNFGSAKDMALKSAVISHGISSIILNSVGSFEIYTKSPMTNI